MTVDKNLTKAQLLQQLETLRAEHEKTEKSLAGYMSRTVSMRTEIDAMHELRRKDDKFYSEEKAKYKEHLKKTVIALATVYHKLGNAAVAMGTAVTAEEYIAAIKTVGDVRAEAFAALDKETFERAFTGDFSWVGGLMPYILGMWGVTAAVLYGAFGVMKSGDAKSAGAQSAGPQAAATQAPASPTASK